MVPLDETLGKLFYSEQSQPLACMADLGKVVQVKDDLFVVVKIDTRPSLFAQGGEPVVAYGALFTRSFDENEVWPESKSQLLQKIRQNRTRDLPVFLNAGIFNNIVSDFVRRVWLPASLTLLQEVFVLIRDFVMKSAFNGALPEGNFIRNFPLFHQVWFLENELIFGSFFSSCQHFQPLLEDCLDKHLQFATDEIKSLVEKECYPSTQNHYLNENVQRMRNEKMLIQIEQLANADGMVAVKNVRS